jgi:hypothetical protein
MRGSFGLYLDAIRFTRVIHAPSTTIALNASPDATIMRPCLRMNLDLCDSSANGVAIIARSSSVIARRSTSRSDSASSSTPRNAAWIYHSHTTRKTTREKNPDHSSRVGGPDLGSLGDSGGSVAESFERGRPRIRRFCGFSSSGSSSRISASTTDPISGKPVNGSLMSSELMASSGSGFGSGIPCSARCSIASCVSPLFGGVIGLSGIADHYLIRFAASFFAAQPFI